jgi:hypothetical protein
LNADSNSPYKTEPLSNGHLQWRAVLGAGFIAGLVLMIVPSASPWSGLTFFAPVIMGRVVPEELGMPVVISKTLHLLLSLLYGFVVALVVMRVTQLRAVLVGAGMGFVLYLGNFGIVSALVPEMRGNELIAGFSHLVFGGIAGGAYRGLLRRKVQTTEEVT